MYADKITDSMQQTIEETNRRRTLQLAYNEEHGITPQAIIKARNRIIGKEEEAPATPKTAGRARHQEERRGTAGQEKRPAASPYEMEFSTSVDIAADPVIPYMNADELRRSIDRLRLEMVEQAKLMEFIEAARLRDEMLKMQAKLDEMEAAK